MAFIEKLACDIVKIPVINEILNRLCFNFTICIHFHLHFTGQRPLIRKIDFSSNNDINYKI